jgi:hypothetical protein
MDGANERAAQRRANAAEWPLRSYALTEEPLHDPFDRSTVDERIATMWPLTREAWAVAGKAIPSYLRAAIPGFITRQHP